MDPVTLSIAALFAVGKISGGFARYEMGRYQARYLRNRAGSALRRADIDTRNMQAQGAYSLGSVQQQYAQASAQNRLAAYASGVRGHGRLLRAQDQRFQEELRFQNMQIRQQGTLRQLAGVDQYLNLHMQAELAKAKGKQGLTEGLLGGLESFAKVGGFV